MGDGAKTAQKMSLAHRQVDLTDTFTSDDVVVSVKHVSKKFCRNLKRSMAYGIIDLSKNLLSINPNTTSIRKDEFWALKNVDFEVKQGEVLGIIGQNGSGKSTLLRLLTGIFPPDTGEIMMKGRVGSLIAVGAGFHPHMTGSENIYLNGAILGMTKQEIQEKFDLIVNFAEIGDFIDAPISTYSSGMYVRLGFAIAIHANPQILLADEILAVGDLRFSNKCYRKISDFRRDGGTVLLVSHSMNLIRNACQRGIWIEKGTIVMSGSANDVANAYEKEMMDRDMESIEKQGQTGAIINTDPLVKIVNVVFLDENGKSVKEYTQGEQLILRIYYSCKRPVSEPVFTFVFFTFEKMVAIENYSNFDGKYIPSINGEGYIDCIIDRLDIKSGVYAVTVTIKEHNDLTAELDYHDKCYYITVLQNDNVSYGLFSPHSTWRLQGETPDQLSEHDR